MLDTKKTICLLKAICICLFSVFAIAQPSAFIGGQCVSINGMYVSLGNEGGGVLGDFDKETELLEFSKKNGINYLIFYDLEGIGGNTERQSRLASLISRGRQHYGIDEVGAALGSTAGADEIAQYNNSHNVLERVDVLNLEYEFWNSESRSQAFSETMQLLGHFESVASQQNMETEIYIGWITEAEGASIADAVDRVLVHYYRQNDTDIINYGSERLQYLGSGSSTVRIAPIFSNEGPDNTGDPTGHFMGPWLENHSMDQPYKTWAAGYQQLNGDWKQNIEVMGGTWFLYNYFSDIPNFNQNNIVNQPQSSSVCTGDSTQLSFSSTAIDRDIGWFKDDQCMEDTSSVTGTDSDTLLINSVTNDDFSSYHAKVISYDAANPSIDATDHIELSRASYCQGNPQNQALGKTVSASSHVAAGYEPSLIVDGDATATRWASEYTGNQWIQVDLGGEYNISEIKLYWDAAYAIDYQILVSVDGSNWQVITDIESNAAQFNSYQYQSQTARYVRVSGTEKALPQWGFSMYEMEVMGTPAGTNTGNMN